MSNLICGFIHPDHGKILLNGSDIADKSIKERGEAIGLVMQNPNQMISKPMILMKWRWDYGSVACRRKR